MKDLSLVILAAGMGSRYGSLKQMDAFGPNDETIMDYSIFDAKRAGFNHIVFIIRESFEVAFREKFESRFGKDLRVDFVKQELDKSIGNFTVPEYREKPWGTAHALLMAKEVVKGPFAIINADDYYGVEAYKVLANHLNQDTPTFCIVSYKLNNTLSDYGQVNRGVCSMDGKGNLIKIVETKSISKSENGLIEYPTNNGNKTLEPDTLVSMNMFGFTPEYFERAEVLFKTFLADHGQEEKSEFYIPVVLDEGIQNKTLNIKVLTSPSKWFGVTYAKDKPYVQESFKKLIDEGVYPKDLWS